MLTEFEREELDRLTATTDKRRLLEEQRDQVRGRNLELTRELNRCEAVRDMLAGKQFQDMLANASTLAQEYQSVLQDYKKAPASKGLQIERLQIGNSILEGRVQELKQRIQEENQREDRLEAAMLACDRQLGELIDQKESLENEVNQLTREVTNTRDRHKAMYQGLFPLEGLSQKEQAFVRSGKLDFLVYQLTQDSKRDNEQKTRVLVNLVERLFHLVQLSTMHEQAQKHFSNYSSGQSEQDLINQERALAQEIEETKRRIAQEREAEERAVQGCEQKAKEEANQQVEHWLKGRLEILAKKKNCVESMCGVMVPGNEDEQLEAREMKAELWRLGQEEEGFRQRLNERGFHV